LNVSKFECVDQWYRYSWNEYIISCHMAIWKIQFLDYQ